MKDINWENIKKKEQEINEVNKKLQEELNVLEWLALKEAFNIEEGNVCRIDRSGEIGVVYKIDYFKEDCQQLSLFKIKKNGEVGKAPTFSHAKYTTKLYNSYEEYKSVNNI